MERRIHEGMKVRGADGSRLGKVVSLGEETFVVEKGLLFHKDRLARYEQVGDIRNDEIWLREQGDLLSGRPAPTAGAGTTAGLGGSRSPEVIRSMGYRDEDSERFVPPVRRASAYPIGASTPPARPDPRRLGTERADETRIPLREEQLHAEKRSRLAGEVEVRKEVHTEHRQVTVPVTREEVHVERRSASDASQAGGQERPGTGAFREDTVRIPVYEEEVELHKRPVVREEVRVTKDTREEEERLTGETRRETAEIHREGGDRDRRRS